ncbi:MAG: hypothetical protein O2894_05775 [Planctomycetota bacterium]|nr:hypothetical protein [Planctomycetota bacterium]
MTASRILLALLLTTASFVAGWFVVGQERLVPLSEVEEGPRVPVAPDARTTPQILTGLSGHVKGAGNDLRTRRNELAARHKREVAEWRAGRRTLREVEATEQLLWIARCRVGEITEHEMHLRLAELFGREHERLVILHAQGLAGVDQVDRAALYVAREQHLAGQVVKDAMGRDYDGMRRAYLDQFRRTHEALIDAGLSHREQLKVDLDQLAADFPPVGNPR